MLGWFTAQCKLARPNTPLTRRDNPSRRSQSRHRPWTSLKVTQYTQRKRRNINLLLFRTWRGRTVAGLAPSSPSPRRLGKVSASALCYCQLSRSTLGFPVVLRVPANPQTTAVVEETSSTSAFRVMHMNICYYYQDLLPGLLHGLVTARFNATSGIRPTRLTQKKAEEVTPRFGLLLGEPAGYSASAWTASIFRATSFGW